MCCTRLAANTGRKNYAKNRHLRTIAQLCRAISSQLRNISIIGKKLVKQQYFPHIIIIIIIIIIKCIYEAHFRGCHACPYNIVNFGRLAAEIVSLVWGTPANFNGFRVLAALLHSQTAALNRGHHLYMAGRPSRWALTHISSYGRSM